MFIAHRLGSPRSAALARLALILSVAVVVAGCDLINSALLGSGAGSIGGAVPSEPPQVPPDTWTIIELTNPRLQLEIPTTWQQVPSSAYEGQLKGEVLSQTGDIVRALQYEIGLIDNGEAIDFFEGQSADTRFTASIEIDVIANAGTLAEAVAREESTNDGLFGPPATRDQAPVTLPIGPAIQEITTSSMTGGSPSQAVVYYLLFDGRTIVVGGSAPVDDTTFPDLMAHVAASLSQN